MCRRIIKPLAARGLCAHLLQIAGPVLTQVRQFDAAQTALQRALDDAPDRLRGASVITTWSRQLLQASAAPEGGWAAGKK
ncbi:hypothetical protein [Streptomyces tubercidicus]|uniref:hypothetical protein n=1 Tax=Streptomyces tubercidicus TaxID=47759 RepID=UPI0034675AE4